MSNQYIICKFHAQIQVIGSQGEVMVNNTSTAVTRRDHMMLRVV